MEPDWKAIEARLTSEKRYYDGVYASLLKRPPEPVAGRSAAQQQEAIADIVKRLDDALKIAKRLNAQGT